MSQKVIKIELYLFKEQNYKKWKRDEISQEWHTENKSPRIIKSHEFIHHDFLNKNAFIS